MGMIRKLPRFGNGDKIRTQPGMVYGAQPMNPLQQSLGDLGISTASGVGPYVPPAMPAGNVGPVVPGTPTQTTQPTQPTGTVTQPAVTNVKGNFGEKNVNNDLSGGTDPSNLVGGVAGGIARYAIPAAYGINRAIQNKQLKDQQQVNLETPQLNVGRVRDMVKPNFARRFRPEAAGSSLRESQAVALQDDAMLREMENQYTMQNEQARIQQEASVLDRMNQQAQMDAQIANQQESINAQTAARERMFGLQDQASTVSSIFQNLDKDVYGTRLAKTQQEMLAASNILRSENSSEEDTAWARKILGIGRYGKKLTRFSRH